jgi:hypothetical protein
MEAVQRCAAGYDLEPELEKQSSKKRLFIIQ